MLRIKLLNAKQKSNNIINSDNSLLIIGKGNSPYKLRKIEHYESAEDVKMLYKDSDLYNAFVQASNIGAKNIYLLNIQNITDYIEIVDVIKQYNFAYIVPLNIYLSNSFYHAELKRQMSYAEYFLSTLKHCNSLIIFTDNHASLYEDIDNFLDDMKQKINNFKKTAEFTLMYGRKFCFVSNNLEDYKFANVAIGAALASCGYENYPDYDFGQAIFDIDYFDIRNLEMIYFKNNTLKNTTIENLINFRIEKDADKIILIDKAIRYIERYLDLSKYNGKLYSEYIRLQIYSDLSAFLRSIQNKVIRDYSINSVTFIKQDRLTGTILNDFNVLPINSIEDFNINMEV